MLYAVQILFILNDFRYNTVVSSVKCKMKTFFANLGLYFGIQKGSYTVLLQLNKKIIKLKKKRGKTHHGQWCSGHCRVEKCRTFITLTTLKLSLGVAMKRYTGRSIKF